jgi:Trypsin-like peptidase domain
LTPRTRFLSSFLTERSSWQKSFHRSPLPSGAVVAKLGGSDKVEVGDQIFVIGAPHGISYTLTVGYISARRRPNTLHSGLSLTEFFQTDAAINQGNSGGPMLNWLVIIFGDTMWFIQRFIYSSRHLSRDVTIKASAGCAKVTRRGHTNGEEINESPNESIFICGKYLLTRS